MAKRASSTRKTTSNKTSRPNAGRLVARVKEPSAFATLDETEQYIEAAPWEYLECRVGLRHKWDHHGGHLNDDGTVTRVIICDRCGTERKIKYTRSGRPQGSRYEHPEGYVNEGHGRFDADDMDLMRSAILTKLIEE